MPVVLQHRGIKNLWICDNEELPIDMHARLRGAAAAVHERPPCAHCTMSW